MRGNQIIPVLVMILLVVLFVRMMDVKSERPRVQDATYTEFLEYVKEGEIKEITITASQFKAEGTRNAGGEETKVTATLPPDAKVYMADLQAANPEVRVKIRSRAALEYILGNAAMIVLPLLLIVFLWFMMMRQFQGTSGQALTFGRSRAKMLTGNFPKVTFNDVAGMEEVKEELVEVVDFLKEPDRFRSLGAKIPKGVLLLGPPGCGKTLLARAVAGEADVSFFYISGSDFVEMFVGVGASRVRDLFDQAKAHRPAIVFIDEIDAVGRQRGAGLGGGHDEREQTLNALLVEMDGFEANSDVILLAATNRPDVLDPALLRPGRFDRRVVVHTPDVNERKAIFQIYIKDKPVAETVDVDLLARRTPGFSGADIENLVNEAALIAARRKKKRIEPDDFDEAADKVIAGPERKSRIISDREKRIIAYHEAGHALVGALLPDFGPVQKVTILSRGMSLGYTMRLPSEDRYLMSREELLHTVSFALAGRAAEEIVFHQVTTGAQDDLEKATDIARAMVCEYGMSETLGPRTFGKKHGPVFLGRDLVEEKDYSDDVAATIDREIRDLIEKRYEVAKQIITDNLETLDRLVEVLLEKETIEADALLAIIRGEALPEAGPAEGGAEAEPSDARAPAARSEQPAPSAERRRGGLEPAT
jgi:cell division protease FtsH